MPASNLIFTQCCSAQTGKLANSRDTYAVDLNGLDYTVDGKTHRSVQFYHRPGKCPLIGRAMLTKGASND